ncbi:MAG: redoxin family protein [Microthrixaceae bacterium]
MSATSSPEAWTIVGEHGTAVGGTGDTAALSAGDLAAVTGWVPKPEGWCRGAECIPASFIGDAAIAEALTIEQVADALGTAVAVDDDYRIAVIGNRYDSESTLESGVAPDVELTGLDGERHRLFEEGHGKTLVVAFSSWCGCRYDLPGWKQLKDELADHDFGVVAVAIDESTADVAPWATDIDYPVLVDTDRTFADSYGLVNVPTVIWLDEERRVVRQPAAEFSDDQFTSVHGIESGPHLEAVRAWVREGVVPDADAPAPPPSLGAEQRQARAEFRLALELKRRGHDEAAADRVAIADTRSHPTTSPSGAPACSSWATIRSEPSSSIATPTGSNATAARSPPDGPSTGRNSAALQRRMHAGEDRHQQPAGREPRARGGGLVGETGDDHRTVGGKPVDGLSGHVGGGHPHELGQRPLGLLRSEARRFGEPGLDGPGAQHRHADTARCQFATQRVTVGEDERLGRGVPGLTGKRLERGRGCHVQDRTGPPFGHAWHEQAAEVCDRLDIGADHPDLRRRVAGAHRPRRRQSGVVDEHLHSEAAFVERGSDGGTGVDVGEVGGDHLRPDAVPVAQFGRQLVERTLPTRHEGDAVSAAGQLAGDLRADPRRGAGHDAGEVGARCTKRHGETLSPG